MVKISIATLIYKSKRFADWVHNSAYEYTPYLQRGEAEFYFVANDPTDDLLAHLNLKGYKHYANYNGILTEDQLFMMGYGKPEYIHRVYKGWNKAILHARGEIVVLVNSDNYFSPDWLENLLKYFSSEVIICSKLVERMHPKHGVFNGAYHGEFGHHPDNFDKRAFLDFCDMKRITGVENGGAYMPCMFYRDLALKVGLYPEGNIAGKSFEDVVDYGDRVFFKKLERIGVKHYTALDSLVYHLKEGEMETESTEDSEEDGSVHFTAASKATEEFKRLEAADAFNRKGVDLLNIGDIDGARAAFLQSVGQNPEFAIAHNNLGLISYLQNKHDIAIRHFERALELEPSNSTIFENIDKTSEILKKIR